MIGLRALGPYDEAILTIGRDAIIENSNLNAMVMVWLLFVRCGILIFLDQRALLGRLACSVPKNGALLYPRHQSLASQQ